MPTASNYVRLEFPSRAENVKFARTAVAIFASGHFDWTIDELDELKVATSEAVSNAIVHGYGHESGIVAVTAAVEGDTLVVTVEDRGRGIDDVAWARRATHTTAPEEHMGLGLVFIDEYMNDVKIESRPGRGTTVRMCKVPTVGARRRSAGD